MKRILITGATGFLGKILTSKLAGDYNLTLLGRNFSKDNNWSSFESIIKHDLTEGKISSQHLKPWDIVIHAAGKAHVVPKTESECSAFFDVNYQGTRNLVESIESNLPKSFIFISSIAVYGDQGIGFSEDSPLKANKPYGRSKIKAERFLMEWAKDNDVNLTILRIPLLAGPNVPGNLEMMIRGIKSNRYFRIGNGAARKSMVWADDIAEVVPRLVNISGTYNLTDGHNPSFKELEDVIAERLGKRVRSIPNAFAKITALGGSALNSIGTRWFPLDKRSYSIITNSLTMDDTKARRDFGWKPNKVVNKILKS